MSSDDLLKFPRDFVGYGPDPPRVEWPDKARIAVQIVVNYEAGSERSILQGESSESYGEFAAYGKPPRRDLTMDSIFEYGSRVGVWRLLRIFKRFGVHVTFFATAKALELNPLLGPRLVAEGHEICSHGYRWLEHYSMSMEEERASIRSAVETIKRMVGQRPLGWYCREPSVHTFELLLDEGGFLYASDVYNDEIPYYHKQSGRSLLLVPYTPDANDFHFFSNRFANGADFFTYLKDTFDLLYEEGAESPKMMSIGLHDRISGRPGRATAVKKFLEHISGLKGVWVARRVDIAKWWLEHHPPE